MTIVSLLLVAFFAIALVALLQGWASSFIKPKGIVAQFANIAEGTHPGSTTKKTDGAYGRHLVVAAGSDVNHVALAGTASIPIGVTDDESTAAEDFVNVSLLGSIDRTVLVQASAAIALYDFVVAAANGQVRTLPATTGTYYIIGRALNAAASTGDLVEIDPINCTQRVVP